MPNNTMTLQLNGEITFRDFAEAVSRFNLLVDALSAHLDAREGVDWFVDDLEIGSATTTIRGESPTMHKVESVIEGFAEVGQALQAGTPVPFTSRVASHAEALSRIINQNITSIKLETAQRDFIIKRLGVPSARSFLPPTYGAIEGRIQTLSNRRSLRFTLFDVMHDRAVSCYLEEGYEHIIREAWGHEAVIEGLITRDPESGRPITIRQISHIKVISDLPANYLNARGILDVPEDAPSPEEIIRRMRDG